MRQILLRSTFLLCCMTPAVAHAQTDEVIVMRKVISPALLRTDRSTAPSDQAGTWVPGPWRWSGASTCQDDAPQVRDMTCQAFGKVVADSRCKEDRPIATGKADRTDSCTYRWIPGQYTQYAPRCSTAGIRSRQIDCQRIETSRTVDAAFCPQATRPEAEQTDMVTASCKWDQTEWSTPAACGKVTQTRTVSCMDVDTRSPAATALCTAAVSTIGAKPALTQDVNDYGSCSYSWQVTSYGGWKTACSATAKRDKIYSCVRSDGNSVTDTTLCTQPKPVGEDVGISPCTDAVKNPSFETTASWTGSFIRSSESEPYAYQRPSYYATSPVTGRYMALFSDGAKYNQTGPRQTIAVVAGTKYKVSAYTVVPPSNNGNCAADHVRLFASNGSQTIDGKGPTPSSNGTLRLTETPTFTATGTSIVIGLEMVSTCNTGNYGAADDVSVSIMP